MDYNPERYWEDRYSRRQDLTRSGHCDLPEPYNRWLYRRKQNVLRRALHRIGFAPRGKRILEVGAGMGAYVDFWKRLEFGSITGLELSTSATEYLKKTYPGIPFFRRDITDPNLRDDTGADFDLVTAIDVLYHVVDNARLDAALRNIHDVLQPRGIFAVSDQFLHRPTEHHGYLCWRSLDDWHRALAAAGFEVLSRTPFFYGMIQTNDCETPTTSARMDALWDRFINPAIQRLPMASGALLYSVDSTLGTVLSEGPSMEVILARRTT